MTSSIRIGRLAGIPIGIQPLWIVIVALITWSLGANYYPEEVAGIAPGAAYALGLASALLLFASILLHELGHSIVARRHGIEVEEIDLWLLGGVAKMRGTPRQASDELRYALAGPAVTVLVVAFFALVLVLLPAGAPRALEAILSYQLIVNVAILVLNMLPAFPLDGGRVTRALIWRRRGDLDRATVGAARLGRGFAYLFIGLGLLALLQGAPGGLWFALIGFFMLLAGNAELSAQRTRSALRGEHARDLMAFPAVTIPAETRVDEAVPAYFERYRFRGFPVTESGVATGIVTIGQVESLLPEARSDTRVGDLALKDPELFIDPETRVTELLERQAFQRAGRAVVVGDGPEVGIVSVTEVERAVRAHRLATGS